MGIGQMIGGGISLVLAVGAFVISCLQFKEKGYLFNNAYIWASKAERKQMEENKQRKRPHYRQSGFTFLFVGISFLALAIYSVTDRTCPYIAFWASMITALVYAVVSSVQIERRK